MSTACDVTPHARRLAPHLLQIGPVRWAALGALLFVEFLAFTFRFDTESIEQVDATWATLLGHTWLASQFVIAIAVALLVFGGHRVTDAWRQLLQTVPNSVSLWRPLAIHAGALLAFYGCTAALLEGGLADSSAAAPAFVAWGALGFVAFASWCAALLPLSVWRALAYRIRGILALGAILAVVALLAAQAANYFWPLLSGPTMGSVEAILRIFYSNVVVYPEEIEIGVGAFVASIGPECSGFEGMGLVGVFVGAFLWSFRDRLQFPLALVLLPLGMGIIWCANVLRIAALIAIGASLSESVAWGGFHSQAGWLVFNAVALGLVYLAWNSSAFRAADAKDHAIEKYEYPAGPYLLPMLSLVAVMMITTAMSAQGFDWLYPVRVVAALAAVGFFWTTYRRRGLFAWSWSWSPLLIGAGVFAMWMALEPMAPVASQANADQAQALASLPPTLSALWIILRAVGSIIAVPIAEELAFRGFLLRKLDDDDFESVPFGRFTWYALLISSVLFGLLHGRWLAGTLAGVLFAYALRRRGSLMDAIVAHATANALITAYVLLTGNWASWS